MPRWYLTVGPRNRPPNSGSVEGSAHGVHLVCTGRFDRRGGSAVAPCGRRPGRDDGAPGANWSRADDDLEARCLSAR